MVRRVLAAAIALVTAASAQPAGRRATNIAAILAFPAFFHGRSILVVGTLATDERGTLRLSDAAGSLRVIFNGTAPEGLDEVRGEFWDLGRMRSDDPRLATLDVRRTFQIDPDAAWPRAGEVTAIIGAAVTQASPPPAPSIRSIVLQPSRYLEQWVTVTGQFAGRNLFGDLPDAPAKSRWDFVLRSADAAIWVSGVRPRGKGFDLALDSRIDTDRWLAVSGTVRHGRGLQWIEATADGLALDKPPTDAGAEEQNRPVQAPAAPPPEVIFSAPIQDETDVSLDTTVRIQFSRDIDPATLKGHVRVQYAAGQAVEPAPRGPEFTTQYVGTSRLLEIRFAQPLEPFRVVRVDVTGEVIGADHQPLLRPWTLTFSLGGR
jgi:hypothetical protein